MKRTLLLAAACLLFAVTAICQPASKTKTKTTAKRTTVKKKSNTSIWDSLSLKNNKGQTGVYQSLKLKNSKKSMIKVVYEIPGVDSLDPWVEGFKEAAFLDTMASVINKLFILKKNLTLSMKQCYVVNAFYNDENREITLCPELVKFLYDFYKPHINNQDSLSTRVGNTVAFVYFHEVGHAMIDLLDIPITGKEEDAADYFSFYLLGSNGVEEGVNAVLDGASFFFDNYQQMISSPEYDSLKKAGKETLAFPFWDEHSLDAQRFYTLTCLLYGSDPDKYDFIRDKGYLGGRRPGICIKEFQKIKRSWDRLLEPHLRK